jgi:hypothetical protein
MEVSLLYVSHQKYFTSKSRAWNDNLVINVKEGEGGIRGPGSF